MKVKIKIEQTGYNNGCPEYRVEYEKNGNKVETTVTNVYDTINYSNDLLPEYVMDCVDEIIRED